MKFLHANGNIYTLISLKLFLFYLFFLSRLFYFHFVSSVSLCLSLFQYASAPHSIVLPQFISSLSHSYSIPLPLSISPSLPLFPSVSLSFSLYFPLSDFSSISLFLPCLPYLSIYLSIYLVLSIILFGYLKTVKKFLQVKLVKYFELLTRRYLVGSYKSLLFFTIFNTIGVDFYYHPSCLWNKHRL